MPAKRSEENRHDLTHRCGIRVSVRLSVHGVDPPRMVLREVSDVVTSDLDAGDDDAAGDPAEPLPGVDHGRQVPAAAVCCGGSRSARQRSAELEAVHGRAADLQHGAVRLRLRRSWRSSPGCRSTGTDKGMLAPTTIFHSVVSFMTNTDLQHYSGDQHFSNFSQIFFGIANFFLSASIGFCALTAIIRAAARREDDRQLLRRYVAGRRVHVPARSPSSCRSSSCSREAR